MRITLLTMLTGLTALACWAVWSPAQEIQTGPMPRPLDYLDRDLPRRVSPLVELRQHLQKLKEERAGLQEDQGNVMVFQNELTTQGQDLSRLRKRLHSLLDQIQLGSEPPPPRPLPSIRLPQQGEKAPLTKEPMEPKESLAPKEPRAPTPQKKDQPTPEPTAPDQPAPWSLSPVADPMALAQALYRAGNYQGALQAYRLISLEGLKAQERAPLQYMMATCLRKQGKIDQAADLYREVANSRGDEVMAENAQWQLQYLRWRKELAEQIQQVRHRSQALENQP